ASRRRDRIPPQIRRGIAAESRRGGRPRQGDARSRAGKSPVNLKDWIGRTETVDDIVTAMPYAALSATLDREPARPKPGTPLPALWHWLYFLPLHRQSEIGPDGNARRGGFLPPVARPRRMWAGSQLQFHRPRRVGDSVTRVSTIQSVDEKSGRSGALVFVKVRHEFRANGEKDVALTELHDIVYREAAKPADVAPAPRPVPGASAWEKKWVPDEVLLFRYSALTFNGHRIHYDRRYVTQVEGYPGLIVHGPLIATLLVDLLRWQLPEARVAKFEFRALRPIFDTRPFFVCGQPQTERIGYPVLGVVQQLVELCADGLGEWCHWGATTQDITDTATVLQIREGLVLIEDDLAAISAAMAELASRHRDTPMIGRSNLQQAVPVTFGYKMAGILSAIERHRARLAELRPRVLMGEFAGAAGTLASLGQGGLETQAGLMKELGLAQPAIAWHTLRDTIAEVGCFLGLVTGTLGKLALDVKLMMQTEVGEAYEPFAHGRGSSSTMPQKRNPISSCYIHACASVVRQQVAALLDAMLADHERSTGPWEIEWIALPEAFLLSAGALNQAKALVAGLEVDAKRMRANLDSTKGLVVSEAVMMGLAPYLGRGRAHDLV